MDLVPRFTCFARAVCPTSKSAWNKIDGHAIDRRIRENTRVSLENNPWFIIINIRFNIMLYTMKNALYRQ
jgi:hypothetical protein